MKKIDTDFGEGADPKAIAQWAKELRRLQGLYDRALDRAEDAHRLQNDLLQRQRQTQADLNQVNAQIPGAQAAADGARAKVADLFARLEEHRAARDAATARLLGMVQTTHPVVLLPVRLETRFVSRQADFDLLIRIYPDDIHIDAHEPGLTQDEEQWGKQFWTNTAAAGNDNEKRKLAWRQLADRFGVRRAAWIARVLEPGQPPVAHRDDTWTRAPQTTVLPDRWVAVGYRKDRPIFTAWGNPIPDQVVTGLSPQGQAEVVGDNLPPVNKDMRWMIDFEAAVAIGMGLRIPLTHADLGNGVERLVVVGVKSNIDANQSGARLAGLLEAQHYTHDLAFVPQNTATNNTTETSSGYTSGELGDDRDFEIERSAPLVQPADSSDGNAVATAFGIAGQVFAHVRAANQSEQRAAQAMNTALWPVLNSSLLRQLSPAPAGGSLRDHFIENLRGRGPLPALRVGNQPYGLLPVASLNRWRQPQQSDSDATLVNFLLTRSRTNAPYRRNTPRVALGTDMPTLLRQEANSYNYVVTHLAAGLPVAEVPMRVPRSAIPLDDTALLSPPNPNYLTLLRQSDAATILSERYPGWDAKSSPRPHPLLYLLLRQSSLLLLNPQAPELAGFRESLARLENQSVAALQFLLAESLDVASYRLDAWVTSLATKRLKALRQTTPLGARLGAYGCVEDLRPSEPLRPVPPPTGDTGGPLFASDRNKGFVQAPSLAHAATAAVLRSAYLSHKDESDGDPLAVNLSSERVHRAQWVLEGVRQGQSLGALLGYRFERGLHDNRLDRFIFPFRALAGLKAQDELAKAYENLQKAEKLAQEVGELYRQSADATARANQLAIPKQRREAERQQYQDEINAISALEQVARNAEAEVTTLDQKITKQLADKPHSSADQKQGKPNFTVEILDSQDLRKWADQLVGLQQQRQQTSNTAVLARSKFNERLGIRALDQAKISALNDPANPNSIAALDAQIARERATAAALDQQALSKEGTRGKAEADLGVARNALGELLNQQWQKALESLAANNVVDGLELQRRWRIGRRRKAPEKPWDATTIPFGNATLGFPALDTTDFKALDAELQALDEMVDAVSDVVLAESVYHLVQGNPIRSGATLDAIATGKIAPPELDVTRTPRTGIGLTHRLLVLWSSSDGGSVAAWPVNADQVRAPAEPLLNAWAAQLLGNPAQIRCRGDYVDTKAGRVLASSEVKLNQLQLSPLDVVFMAEGNEVAHRSELEQRVVYQLIQKRPTAVPAEAEVRLTFARDPAWAADIVSFGELVEVARTVRKLIAGSRAIDGRDVSLPEAPASAAIDSDELGKRADNSVKALQQAQQKLQPLLASMNGTGTPDLDGLRAALLRMAQFGVQGAVPLSAAGDSPEKRTSLQSQGLSVAREVTRRLDTINKLSIGTPPTDETKRDFHLARFREVFGRDFRVLPRLTPQNGTVLNQAFGDSLKLQDNNPLAAITWFQRLARVRDGVERLDSALLYAEALGSGARLKLDVAQLPFKPQDRWIALPAAPDQSLPGGRLSLVAHLPAAKSIAFDKPLAGLLIDEWVEVVPSRSETTGLTFHYDQPTACAPQSVLIAVPSDTARNVWDLDILASILNETLDLAGTRALSLDGRTEGVWVEDELPAGATASGDGESWNWVKANPAPFSGKAAHQSALAAGMHQHFFLNATDTLGLDQGEILLAYVFLDPTQVPSEVMLQWNDGSWEHRAYWGANKIGFGVDGTASRRFMGPLPTAGQWVRLEVPAQLVGLEGREVSGMAFTLCDGRATWDRAGKACRPSLIFDGDAIEFSRAAAA